MSSTRLSAEMVTKNVLVLGGTGTLGVFFCQRALAGGHKLTIYARNPSKLPDDISKHAAVKVIEGELNNDALLSSALKGQDVVVSILGPTASLSARSLAPGTFTTPYRTILNAMRQCGVKRIFVMGTASIPDPRDKAATSAKLAVLGIKTLANAAYTEIVSVGKLFEDEAGDVDWTMYRIGVLSNSTGKITASYIGEEDWNIWTFRPDVAKWLADQVGKDVPEHVRERPFLSSKKQ